MALQDLTSTRASSDARDLVWGLAVLWLVPIGAVVAALLVG